MIDNLDRYVILIEVIVHLLHLPKVLMPQRLIRSQSLLWIESQQPLYQIQLFISGLTQHFTNLQRLVLPTKSECAQKELRLVGLQLVDLRLVGEADYAEDFL